MPIRTHLKRSPRDLMPVQTRDDKSLRFGVKSQQQFYLCDKDKKNSLCHRNLSRKHDAQIQTCLHLCDDRDEQCRVELFWKLRDSAAAQRATVGLLYDCASQNKERPITSKMHFVALRRKVCTGIGFKLCFILIFRSLMQTIRRSSLLQSQLVSLDSICSCVFGAKKRNPVLVVK